MAHSADQEGELETNEENDNVLISTVTHYSHAYENDYPEEGTAETTTTSQTWEYRPSFSSGVYGSYRTDFGIVSKVKQNEHTLRSIVDEIEHHFYEHQRRIPDMIRDNNYYSEYAMLILAALRNRHPVDTSHILSLSERLQHINKISRPRIELHGTQRVRGEDVIEALRIYQRSQYKKLNEVFCAQDEADKRDLLQSFFELNNEIESLHTMARSHIRELKQQFEDRKRESDRLRTEIISGIARLQRDIEKIFEFAKKIYKQQESPVIVDEKNVLDDVKQNARNYKNVALPMTLGQDKPFETWNEDEFKREFSRKFNIPIECLQISSVKAGSTIIELKITTHDSDAKMMIPIECIAENVSEDKARKELAEFGIFAMEFKEPVVGFSASKQRVIMNPRWNRAYGKGAGKTYWNGPLKDGKSRGGYPYYCPVGWKRYAVQFSETAYDFKNVYDDWPIAYHGTKFDVHYLITLSGLRCSAQRAVFGCGVYLSPSIKYVSHPWYAKPVKLDLKTGKQAKWSKEHLAEWKQYDGKWIQCVFACRVKPGSFKKKPQTMSLGNNGTFDGIDKQKITWVVHGKPGEMIGSDKILIYGYMIKVSDTEPKGYDQEEWGCVVM